MELGPLPEVDPREKMVRQAELEFEAFILDWVESHSLTLAEILNVLVKKASQMLQYAIREERK